jgi:integrase/recombinase XerC
MHIRNRAFLMVLLDTGLRLAEVSNIRIKDVDFDHEIIKVLGKGNKERVVRIGKITQTALWRYLLSRKSSEQTNLWLTAQKRPMSRKGVQTRLT